MCRIIDFKRSLFNVPAIVMKFEYGYRLNSKIALICYRNGMLSYMLAPAGLKKDDIICAGPAAELSVGNALPLRNTPVGAVVHNVELRPGKGGQLMRAAGAFAKVVRRIPGSGEVVIRLSRGILYSLSTQSMATIGTVAKFGAAGEPRRLFKAGESRWMGRRPVVRGVAMNPVDHPHGGGEGRSKGGRHPVSPWGKLTKGWKRRRSISKLSIRRP